MSHIHFRHRSYVLREFAQKPWVIAYLLADGRVPVFHEKALPLPSPLTVYSNRPLGKMAKPLPYMRRPKGYEPA